MEKYKEKKKNPNQSWVHQEIILMDCWVTQVRRQAVSFDHLIIFRIVCRSNNSNPTFPKDSRPYDIKGLSSQAFQNFVRRHFNISKIASLRNLRDSNFYKKKKKTTIHKNNIIFRIKSFRILANVYVIRFNISKLIKKTYVLECVCKPNWWYSPISSGLP